MFRRASGKAVIIVLAALLSVPSSLPAQNSRAGSRAARNSKNDSTRYTAPIKAANKQHLLNFVAQHSRNPEMRAIMKAEQEGRLLDAEKLLQSAVGKAEAQTPPSPRLRFLLNQLGRLELRLGHDTQAVSTARQVLSLDATLPPRKRRLMFIDYQNLAIFSERAGDTASAEKAFKQELALARQNPGYKDTLLLVALAQVERFYERQHRTTDAQALQAEAVQVCESQSGARAPQCEPDVGSYYRQTGHAGYAEDVLSQQASLPATAGKQRTAYSDKLFAIVALAHQYNQDQSYDLAADAYQKAISLAETPSKRSRGKPRNPTMVPTLYDQMGNALMRDARKEDAEAAYQHAFDLRVHATAKDRPMVDSLAYSGLPRFYQLQGRLTDADSVLSQALAAQKRLLGPQDIHLAQTLTELARVKTREGMYYDAEPLCKQALKIEEADYGADSVRQFRTVMAYARVEEHLGHTEQANTLMARARALRKRIRARFSASRPARASSPMHSPPPTSQP